MQSIEMQSKFMQTASHTCRCLVTIHNCQLNSQHYCCTHLRAVASLKTWNWHIWSEFQMPASENSREKPTSICRLYIFREYTRKPGLIKQRSYWWINTYRENLNNISAVRIAYIHLTSPTVGTSLIKKTKYIYFFY